MVFAMELTTLLFVCRLMWRIAAALLADLFAVVTLSLAILFASATNVTKLLMT